MKVAFCLYGLAGGTNDKYGGLPVDYEIGFNHYKKHILSKNDVDIFIHTWSVELEETLRKLYQPKKSIFEQQIVFAKQNIFHKMLYRKDPKRKNNHYSRWYSTKKVIQLKKEYEIDNKFEYDCVFITRFDVAFQTDVIFERFDINKFYGANWDEYYTSEGVKVPTRLYYHTKKTSNITTYFRRPTGYPYTKSGMADLWFFSNSNSMDKFATLYDRLDGYLKECALSSHILTVHHLRKLSMQNQLEFVFHRFDDFALVRRKYFNYTR